MRLKAEREIELPVFPHLIVGADSQSRIRDRINYKRRTWLQQAHSIRPLLDRGKTSLLAGEPRQ